MNTPIVVTFTLITAIVVSLLKTFVELKVRPGVALHDTLIRLFAIVVGMVVVLGDYTLHAGNWNNGIAVENALGTGLLVGVGAILSYHLITSDVWTTLTPGQSTVVDLAPLQAPKIGNKWSSPLPPNVTVTTVSTGSSTGSMTGIPVSDTPAPLPVPPALPDPPAE